MKSSMVSDKCKKIPLRADEIFWLHVQRSVNNWPREKISYYHLFFGFAPGECDFGIICTLYFYCIWLLCGKGETKFCPGKVKKTLVLDKIRNPCQRIWASNLFIEMVSSGRSCQGSLSNAEVWLDLVD